MGLTFGQLFPGPRITPKRSIANTLKYMAQLLPSNRFRLRGVQKIRADKKFGTYPKSADTKITLKGTLNYPMEDTTLILPGVTNDVTGHKNLGLTWGQVSSWQWLTPNKYESQLFLYMAQVLSGD